MATLQVQYNTGDDASLALYTIYWEAQTFTTTGAFTATSVKLLLFRTGTPGNVTVSLRTVAAGVPTGADIDSSTGVTNIDDITTDSAGEWVEFTFSSPIELSATTVYAICIRGGTGSSNRPNIRYDNGTGGYVSGNRANSGNSGTSWTARTADSLFEVWGNPAAEYSELSGTIASESTVSGNLSTTSVSALSGTIAATSDVSGNLGSTAVSIDSTAIVSIKRLVCSGSNRIYYEDI